MSYLDLKRDESHQKRTDECKELSDEELFEEAKEYGDTTYETSEIIRRYNKKKGELKIYGDHISGCQKRPCTCGFQAIWDSL